MVHHLLQFVAFVVAFFVAARVVPGIRIKSVFSAVIFSLAFALLNKLLFIPLVAVTLPAVVLSFGLFLIVINAFLFWLADKLVKGVEIDGFGAALFGSVVTSLVNWGITYLLRLH